GIRDFHVTGVQTCALPISLHGEDAALESDLATPAAGAAGLQPAVRGAAAVAGVALLQGRDLDLAGDAADRLLEVELQHVADVGTDRKSVAHGKRAARVQLS